MLDSMLEGLTSRPEILGVLVVSETEWTVLVTAITAPADRRGWWQAFSTALSSTPDTDEILLNDGTPLEVSYELFSVWSQTLTQVWDGHLVTVGATVPLGELRFSRLCGDRGEIGVLRERFNAPYPPALTGAIQEFYHPFLRGPWTLARLKRAVRQQDVVFIRQAITQFMVAYLDVLYALNGEFLPGKSGWLAGARRLTVAPKGWEDSLTKLATADLALVPSLWEGLAQGLYEPASSAPANKPSAKGEALNMREVLNASDVLIHTDGGCIGNPGPGAWAFLVRAGGEHWEGSGGEDLTTNNKMELTAVIKALEAVANLPDRPQRLEIRTDSQYVKNGITTWIRSWLANGWKTASKEPVKNQDLWERLHALNQEFHPHWAWVKGHAGNADNEACDQLVQKTIRQRSSAVKRP